MGLLCLSARKLKACAKSLEPLVGEKRQFLGREFSHNLPVYFFQGLGDKLCTPGTLSSEGAGCGGGLMPDGLLGNRAPKDSKSEL